MYRIVLSICAVAISSPALAVDVTFLGTVVDTCAVAVQTPGTLGLAGDGLILGSDQGIAVPAVVTILSIGASTIDVSAPSRISAAPAGYNIAAETVEVSYSGAGGLSLISQAYTSGATSFAASNIPLSLLTVNARLNNTDGFTAGSYTLRTVITCG